MDGYDAAVKREINTHHVIIQKVDVMQVRDCGQWALHNMCMCTLCTLCLAQKQLHFIWERGVSKRGVGVYCHLVMDSWMPCTRPLERRKGHTICSPSPPLSSPCVIIIICQIQFGGGSGKAGAYSSIFPHFSHQSILLYPHYHSSHHHHRYFPIIIALIIFYIFYLAPFLFGDVLHLKP